MIIAVTGTPGTGKTLVSRALASMLGFTRIDLNRLAKSGNLYSGYDRKRKCPIVDLEMLSRRIKSDFSGKDIILDSHYSHTLPCDAVILLRCPPGELRRRLERKGFGRRKIQENIDAEIMGIIKEECRGMEVIEINSAGPVGEIADQAAKAVRRLKDRRRG